MGEKLASHVEQGLNELTNAEALGDVDAELRARKVLAAADLDDKAVAGLRRSRARDEAAEARAEAAAPDAPAPAGRSGKAAQQHTA